MVQVEEVRLRSRRAMPAGNQEKTKNGGRKFLRQKQSEIKKEEYG